MALDRITKSLLDTFTSSEDFDKLDQSDAFERFSTYSILSREHPETFNVDVNDVRGERDWFVLRGRP
jgi:hypothetical protein